MSKTVNIRMDEKLKERADKLFSELGLNMSTAVNMFIVQALNYGGLPFEVVVKDDFYNEHNQKRLKESIEQLENGKIIKKTLAELENTEENG